MNMEHIIAMTCHQANKAICESFGDYSQKDWNDADQWQRDSAINGVQYKIRNVSATSEDQHNAWVEDKIANGWVYGEEKDAKKKTHPCITAYENLPPEQKAKDAVFSAIVMALAFNWGDE